MNLSKFEKKILIIYLILLFIIGFLTFYLSINFYVHAIPSFDNNYVSLSDRLKPTFIFMGFFSLLVFLWSLFLWKNKKIHNSIVLIFLIVTLICFFLVWFVGQGCCTPPLIE